ncbi:MAG: sulfotransferase [Rhizomicrobium sp.]
MLSASVPRVLMPSAATPALEEDIRRLRDLQRAGRHAEALRDANALLQTAPANRDLRLIVAIALRNLGRVAEALSALETLEVRESHFGRLHQERGLCHLARREAPHAIAAFRRAVGINAALPACWEMLEKLCREAGDMQQAATAARRLTGLRRLPAEVVAATSLFSDGDLAPAETVIRGYLTRQGDHPEALRLLARIALAHDVLDDAERLLEKVLALSPGHREARYDLADVLVRRHKYLPARAQATQLLTAEPDNPDYRILAATIATALGENDIAIADYRDLIADGHATPEVHLWLGHALKTVGQREQAIEAYRAAADARPDFGDAYWSLANLKTYRFGKDEIARMRRQEAAPATPTVDRVHLCFALGKAFEDGGEIANSWEYYARGNTLMGAHNPYRPETIEAAAAAQTNICTADFFARRAGWGSARRDPIFIVGLPRSGSTLLEQILASHSQVDGTQELPDIPRIVRDLQGRGSAAAETRYPAVLRDMTQSEAAALGERYLADAAVHRTGRAFFVDKMPNNFRHIGLIHLILPNARIIDARREPLACCFSNLKQLFGDGQEFAYGQEDVAHYYRSYLTLMQHWDDALPGRVLRVHHEDVVADLEGSVRRLLDHCGLDFEPGCVSFHTTRRSISTPSSEQVRQPIFADGLESWKKYEAWLAPLKAALGDAVTQYRD